MLTAGALAHPKGEARVDWDTLAAHAGGLWCLTGGEEGPLARTLRAHGTNGRAEARRLLDRLRAIFHDRLSIEVQRHALRSEEELNQALFDLARGSNLPLLATNGVRYAREDGNVSTTCSPVCDWAPGSTAPARCSTANANVT